MLFKINSRNFLLWSASLAISTTCFGQEINQQDTLSSKVLDQVTVIGQSLRGYLSDTSGISIFAGKKTNVITLNPAETNLSQNLGRTVFARIPGVNLWDMDGSGTQMNIGTRGTDAHRSIEMNMRQNGYNTNSDMFGYPENHYAVPMQAVSRVQLVRGSASLQFGSQFGGMMNYILKQGDQNKPFSIESEQTVGSFNLFNSFNAIGGTVGRTSYYAYYNNRHANGWRPNGDYQYTAYHVNIRYALSKKGSISLQFSGSETQLHIAGGQTDAQFYQQARQSNRSRNWFDPVIHIPAIIFNYQLTEKTKLQITTNGMLGERNSVQFINAPDVNDTINTTTGSYNPRQVDRDYYQGITGEVRLLHSYRVGARFFSLAGGIRYFNQQTLRKQKGTGTTGNDNDLTLIAPYGIDLKFHTINYALFAENIFRVSDRFSLTPGLRYEVIYSDLTGLINHASFPVTYQATRTFPLFGLGAQYQVGKVIQLYGNLSQAYRPYLYANITPADQIGIIDPNLKDSKGYDIDLGLRGGVSDLINFDINAFYLFYGDKVGKLTQVSPDNTTYQLTTNIGNSVAQGVEVYFDISLKGLGGGQTHTSDFRLFSSLAYTNARYTTGMLSNGIENLSLAGHRVENTPDWIERGGLQLRHRSLTTTIQVSYMGDQYSDANNTMFVANGIVGYVPSYTLLDWTWDFKFLDYYHVAGGINNLADVRYFSRRINMYPGPGILPGDGRSFYVTFGIKM